jgi:hypothetical protein
MWRVKLVGLSRGRFRLIRYQSIQLLDTLLRRIDPSHVRCYTSDELRQLLEHTGFHRISTMRYKFGLTWGMMLASASTAS